MTAATTIIMSVATEELKLTYCNDIKMLNERKQQRVLSLGPYIFKCHAVIFYALYEM
jgi:hypothetical protein